MRSSWCACHSQLLFMACASAHQRVLREWKSWWKTFSWRTQSLISSFWCHHNIEWYFYFEILFVYFLIKLKKGRGWRETLVMRKRENSKRGLCQNCALSLPKLLSNALPRIPTDTLAHPSMHANIWVSAALQCASNSPSSDKLWQEGRAFQC